MSQRIERVSLVRHRTIAFGLSLVIATFSFDRALATTIGGAFALSAPDGKTVTDQSFAGRWLLVYFGYTSCPDSCPTALAAIAKTLVRLDAEADRVQPIFITLDPRRDTREVVGDYVKSFDRRIIGLTGTQDQIDTVARAYGAYAISHNSASAQPDGGIDHSVYIYLMDPQGRFIRGFDPSWSPDRMAEVVRHAIDSERRAEKRSEPIGRP